MWFFDKPHQGLSNAPTPKCFGQKFAEIGQFEFRKILFFFAKKPKSAKKQPHPLTGTRPEYFVSRISGGDLFFCRSQFYMFGTLACENHKNCVKNEIF